MQLITDLDLQFLELLQNSFQSPLGVDLFRYITFLGDKGLIWILMALVLLATKKNRKVGILLIITLALTALLGEGMIKHIVQRPRPFIEYSHLKTVLESTSGYSFPSGHTASSFAAACILAANSKKYKILYYSLAFLIAFSRLYLMLHYPSDIIGGILLGIFCALCVMKLRDKYNFID